MTGQRTRQLRGERRKKKTHVGKEFDAILDAMNTSSFKEFLHGNRFQRVD